MVLALCACLFLSCACNMLKQLPEDASLLNSVTIETTDKSAVPQEELRAYLKQKPNKRILGLRFHLWLYNKADPGKKNRWNEWLRSNGEAPVVWDATLTDRTVEQLALYFEQKGYYHAAISSDVHRRRRPKVDLTYRIDPSWPYMVRRIQYDIEDEAVRAHVLADTASSLLRRGMVFDSDVLQEERSRIRNYLMNHGYFGFSEYAVTYEADTVTPYRQVDLTLKIRNTPETDAQGRTVTPPFPTYTVRQVTVNAELDYDNLFGQTSGTARRRAPDTIRTDQYTFLMHPDFPVRPSTLAQSIFVVPDSMYRLSEADRTYRHLMNLQTFKLVNVQFSPVAGAPSPQLDMQINLLPFKMQHYGIEVEGTNSGGNIGGAVNLVYQHKSLFRHAEIFDLKIITMLEAIHQEGIDFNSTYEYGAEAGITVPKLLLPFFQMEGFVRQYNPRTVISTQYNYQLRPDYERTIANINLSYHWSSGRFVSHTVRPIDVNFVRLPFLSDRFRTHIAGTYLENSYLNHMVFSGGYTFQWSDQQVAVEQPYFSYFRVNVESAGLLAHALSSAFRPSQDKPYKVFGNAFSQFFKIDFDYRFYQTLNPKSRLVYRVAAAMGVPYGNSKSIPFERKYYAGGANSIRGWKVRTLGPGSYQDTIAQLYPNSTGDIKLEANVEYRFKLFWILEGALFFDVGNVWDYHRDEMRPGADFQFNRFAKEFAMSAGLGLRLDAKFFIFRTDMGFKLRDPAAEDRWRPVHDWHGLHDATLSVGIGYPF